MKNSYLLQVTQIIKDEGLMVIWDGHKFQPSLEYDHSLSLVILTLLPFQNLDSQSCWL